jgi:hypothetical protein
MGVKLAVTLREELRFSVSENKGRKILDLREAVKGDWGK